MLLLLLLSLLPHCCCCRWGTAVPLQRQHSDLIILKQLLCGHRNFAVHDLLQVRVCVSAVRVVVVMFFCVAGRSLQAIGQQCSARPAAGEGVCSVSWRGGTAA
jgi:hypothetical protein